MALALDTIRAAADRVASSFGLEVVDVEFSGGSKHRTLRVFLEKNAAGRAALAEAAAKAAKAAARAEGAEAEDTQSVLGGSDHSDGADTLALPKGVPVEHLSGLTHEDCAHFAQDFGTVLDVEDLIPGAEYTLEVSSPGLERKLLQASDYARFLGSLAKVQTFTPVENNRHFSGRLIAFANNTLTLDLSAVKQKGKAKKNAVAVARTVDIPFSNIEKAHLLAEI